MSTSDNRTVDEPDQDAEPTMMAPEEGRPDGLVALEKDEDGDDDTTDAGGPS